jgi:hypothetical protein
MTDKQAQALDTLPQLGDRQVTVYRGFNGQWVVDARVFKANTLRGDAYWVTEIFKTYAKEADARRFAARLA